MPKPTNPKLNREFRKVREKQGINNRTFLENRSNQELIKRGTPIQKARQAMVPNLSRSGYIAQNGIDREDQQLHAKNPKEFNRRVGATVTRNLLEEAFRQKKKKGTKWQERERD